MNLNKISEHIIDNAFYDTLSKWSSELPDLSMADDILFMYMNSMFRHAKNGTMLTGDDFQRLHINRLRDGRVDASMNANMFNVLDVYIKHETGWIKIEPDSVEIPRFYEVLKEKQNEQKT